jgi:hypothetical protein
VVEPKIESAIIRDRDDKEYPESYIALSSKPKLSNVNFLAVLFPEAKLLAGNKPADPQVSKLTGDGWIGARIESKGNVYFGFFRTEASVSDGIEGFTTDARRFTVFLADDSFLESLYFEGTLFKFKDLSIRSTEGITCSFNFQRTSSEIELHSGKATSFSFSSDNKPKNILLNGASFRGWQYDVATKMVSLKLTAGRHELTIN